MTLYALARIGRAGLGNGLFPWARAELFARRSGARMLAPYWTNFRIGPYLRQEPDKRRYRNFFRSAQHTRGVARACVTALGQRVSETQSADLPLRGSAARPCVVEFRGLGEFFAPLAGEHTFIRDRLWEMTVPALRVAAPPDGSGFIAMHVRRGDLTRQGFSPEELHGRIAHYTPISWFVGMAGAVRLAPSLRGLPIVVFTDGSADELAPLLGIDGVRLAPRRPAIADLWQLTHARLLFASGYSTFSMWASYLGGMPTIYAPGKIQQRVQAGRPDPAEIELEEGADLPSLVCGPFEREMSTAATAARTAIGP
jgi:hypothetical protein